MELLELLKGPDAFGSVLAIGAIVATINCYTLAQLESEGWNDTPLLPILAAGMTLGYPALILLYMYVNRVH